MKKQYLIALAAALLVGLFLVGSNVYKSSQEAEVDALAKGSSEVFIRQHSPVLGSENAKVTIVEFLDPECESCARFAPYVKSFLKAHPGKIKLVARYVPFHKNSRFAIKVLEASRKQGKFWQTLEVVFKTQPYWADHRFPKPEALWQYLPSVGLDVEQLKRDMQDPKIDEIIEMDFADSKRLNVTGTPTFFVNGKPLPRFGFTELRELIEAEVKANY